MTATLPVPQAPFTDPVSGALSYTGVQFLLSVAMAIAQKGSFAGGPTATGLTATGTNQATALQLTAQSNEITQATAGSGVLLSALQQGQSQTVVNASSQTVKVYPPPGATINGAASLSVAPGAQDTFDFWTPTKILTR
jgi:hypothetical protein